jgi:hypothetical protein
MEHIRLHQPTEEQRTMTLTFHDPDTIDITLSTVPRQRLNATAPDSETLIVECDGGGLLRGAFIASVLSAALWYAFYMAIMFLA